MKKIPVEININYQEPYLPTLRHRKPHYRDAQTTFKVYVDSVSEEEAPIAFILSDYSHTQDNKTVVRYYHKRFYVKMNMVDTRCYYGDERKRMLKTPVKPEKMEDKVKTAAYIYRNNMFSQDELPEIKKKLSKASRKLVIISGFLWEEVGEPRYVINTFGLGHNHGGTGLFVETFYNSNISKTRYFNALEGKKAVEEANRIAAQRGDTEDVGRFKEMIQVLIPEAVKVNPKRQHGNGSPLLNKFNTITSKSSSIMEAGLLVMATTMKEINK